MSRKATLDITIIISCITGMVLSYVYLDNFIEKNVILITLGIAGVFSLILLIGDSVRGGRSGRHNRFIQPLLLALFCSIIAAMSYQALAAELPQDDLAGKIVDIDIMKAKDHLTEGVLDVPEDIQRKIILYQWIMGALEQYVSETGIQDVFYCDLENDLLYGDREFCLAEAQRTEWDKYTYPIKNETGPDMKQESYKLMIQGAEHTLYMDVNIKEGKVYIYLKGYGPALQRAGGNAAAYELIETDDNGQIINYPDTYVESDWAIWHGLIIILPRFLLMNWTSLVS